MAQLSEQSQRALDEAVREWQGRFAPRLGYPASRKRPVDKTKAGFPVVQSATGVVVPAAGSVLGATFQVNAGASVVQVFGPVSVPFIVYHFSINSNVAIAEDVRYAIKVSQDNNSSGGVDTTGVSITTGLSPDLGPLALRSFAIDAFPNFHARGVPAYVKFGVFNNIGAARIVHILISLRTIPAGE